MISDRQRKSLDSRVVDEYQAGFKLELARPTPFATFKWPFSCRRCCTSNPQSQRNVVGSANRGASSPVPSLPFDKDRSSETYTRR